MKLLTYQPSEINSGKIYKYLTKINDDKYKHNYVYLIQNKSTLMMYVGVRSCNIEPKEDIGIKYFTSSKYTNFKENPKNWDICIVGDFLKRSSAVCLESALHKQHDVKNNNMFYNKSNQAIAGFDVSGITWSNDSKVKLSNKLNTVQKNGKTISQNSAIKAAKTQEKVLNNGLTLRQIATAKGIVTMSKLLKDGRTIRQIATKKLIKTMTTADKNGSTLYEKAGKKQSKTKMTQDKNGSTIAKRASKKSAETMIKNNTYDITVKGSNNPKARKINILNDQGEIVFKCHGDFGKICKDNDFPYTAFASSLYKNLKVYEKSINNLGVVNLLKKKGLWQYYGWKVEYSIEK